MVVDCERKKAGEIPLVVEDDLTFTMALAAVSTSVQDGDSRQDRRTFLRSYRSLTGEELGASLAAGSEEVTRTVSALTKCLGCKKAVESLHQSIASYGENLGPLVISKGGVVSISVDHVGENNLANLLSGELGRVGRTVVAGDQEKHGKRSKAGGRCALHGLDAKKPGNSINWQKIWDCMGQKCQQEVCLLPFQLIRKSLDCFFKRHKFCSDCTYSVNRAFLLLQSEGEVIRPAPCSRDMSQLFDDYERLFPGVSACPRVKYVCLECDKDFLVDLYNLIEPELCGLSDVRHAMTLDLAQKELLLVIGLTIFERFRTIQHKMEEAELSYNLLNLSILTTIRTSFDMAADRKKGAKDIDLICQELEMDERKEEKKREKKKEKKRNQRAKKKEMTPDSESLSEVKTTGEEAVVDDLKESENDAMKEAENTEGDILAKVNNTGENHSLERKSVFVIKPDSVKEKESLDYVIETEEVDDGIDTTISEGKSFSGDSRCASEDINEYYQEIKMPDFEDETSEPTCSVFCERDHSESRESKENCSNTTTRNVSQGWLTSSALSSPANSKKKSRKSRKVSWENNSLDSGIASTIFSDESLVHGDEDETIPEGKETEDWVYGDPDTRDERCSVFCKLGHSGSEESFSHSVCLAEWLTEQYVQNPGIDLFSAFFLGVNF